MHWVISRGISAVKSETPQCPQRDFSIADAAARAVGYGKQRFTPA